MAGIYKVELREEVFCDLLDAEKWYRKKGKGLEEALTNAFEQCLLRVQQHPYSYQRVSGSMARRALLHKFPYAVIYSIEDSPSPVIYILGFFSTHLNPSTIHDRIAGR